MSWPKYYILKRRTPFAVDAMTWAKWFNAPGNKRVGVTKVAKSEISTVFLGLDHNHTGKGDPVLFETMVFGGPLAGCQWRYQTYAEAERGHAAAVVQVRKAAALIKAIKDKAT